MVLFKTKIMSKSRACGLMASKDGLQYGKAPKDARVAAFPQHIMQLGLLGLQRGREADMGRGWEGMPGLYCTHCERAAF